MIFVMLVSLIIAYCNHLLLQQTTGKITSMIEIYKATVSTSSNRTIIWTIKVSKVQAGENLQYLLPYTGIPIEERPHLAH